MAKWLQQLESFIGGGPGGPRRIKAFRWLVLIGLLGAALLLAASMMNLKTFDPGGTNESGAPSGSPQASPGAADRPAIGGSVKDDPIADIERQLENRLKELLESMVGVGGAPEVLVTVESTEETVVQLNEKESQRLTDESDKSGAKRHITEVTKDGQVVLYETNGGQTPIVVKRLKPKVRGVIIVAKGAENATVHRMIAEAVSRGLDVPTHRISVVPRKSG